MDHGRIVELGTHCVLVAREGTYYRLVRNQLELGWRVVGRPRPQAELRLAIVMLERLKGKLEG